MELKPLKIGNHTINIPIIQGGMGVGISWDNLAGNVSKEGGLGVVSAVGTGYYQNAQFSKKNINSRPFTEQNFYSYEGLKAIYENARKICADKPIGVNILYAINDYARVLQDACKIGFDVIITGAGLPTNMPEFTKNFPHVSLVPIVSSAKALKIICKRWSQRYDKLPDAVIVEGPKSGGHQGFTYEQCHLEEFRLENLIKPIKEEIAKWGDFPLIVAGGIWDKKDIVQMIALGANGVQMGTRFIGTYECDASDEFKKVLLHARKEDISLFKSPVGYPARGVLTKLHSLVKENAAPKIRCISNCVSPCKRGIEAKQVGYCIADRLSDAFLGKVDTGLFFTGTNGYKLDEILSVKKLLEKLVHGENS